MPPLRGGDMVGCVDAEDCWWGFRGWGCWVEGDGVGEVCVVAVRAGGHGGGREGVCVGVRVGVGVVVVLWP